jgi:hypothetical protein
MHSKTEMHTKIWLGNPKKKGLTAEGGNTPLTMMTINILLKLM